MKFYNDDNEEDEFTEEEITLANSFCDACDKGINKSYNEEEYDIIISNLMFSQRVDYLKKAISRARKAFPEDPEFAIWQARFYIWNDQRDEAQQFILRALRHFPPSAELYEEIAFMAYTFHFNLNVRELVTKAIAIEPSSNAYFILTNLYLDKHNVDKAFDCLMEATRYDISVLDNIDLLVLSNDKFKSSRYEAELGLVTRLNKEFPLSKQTWMVTGALNAVDGNHETALQAFEFAYAIEEDTNCLYAIAKEHYMLGHYDTAIDLCWQVHSSKKISPHVLIGMSFRQLGYYDEALHQLSQTNEKDPEYPAAFSQIVEVLRCMGRLDEVPQFAKRFYKSQGLTLERLEWVLDSLCAAEQQEAFLEFCLIAEELFDHTLDYCSWLTEFCYMVHCQDIAIQILKERFADLDDPEIYKHLGYFFALLYIADGKPGIGIQHLQNALIINEEGVHHDFLDLDTDLLYTQNPEVLMMVTPYLDHLPNIQNN